MVLAVLLAHANRRVSTDRLIDEVYGESPPDAARKAIQSYVAQLRSAINADGEVLRSDPPGYVLALSAQQLDSLLFEDQTRLARDLVRSDPAQAAERLRSALALWRGAPFDSLAGDAPSVREEVTRLEELRLTALENRIEADLLAGNTGDLAAELEGMTQANPYRERLWGLYMLALYRTGRQADALQAYSRLRLTLADELGLEPSPDLQQLEDRILSQDPDLTTPLALDGTERTAQSDLAVRNPYKGLRPFSESDSEDFFGRTDLTRQLTERLQRRDPSGRLIALVGASGSGKSSVVAAGLIPHVRKGTIPGSEDWQLLTMYPGTDPYGNLAKELTGPEESPIDVQDRLIGQGIARALEDRARDTLLVIDQFEELFTQVADRERVDRFLDQIVDAVRDERSGVRVIITIRADFLDKPLEHQGLSELLGASIILVPALADHEVSDAVVGPAKRVGVKVEPELVAALIGDVGSRASSLPLMQFALTDVFERRSDDVLTLAAYRSVGGLSGALAKRADGMYDQFSESDRKTCRQVMLRMVALSEDGGAVRRRVSRADLSGHDPEALERVIDELGRNRLVTFDRSPSGAPTIEVPHESLAREWPRLRRWIDASRSDLETRARLSRAAGEWVESDRDAEFLLGGSRLVTATSWLEGTDLDPGTTEIEFISESEAHEHRLNVARTRRRRTIGAVLGAAAVVAALFGVVALAQRNSAQEQTRLAVAQQLSASALNNLDDDPQLSLLLALEAADTTAQDDVVIREAVEALHQSVLASRVEWVADLGSAGDSIGARFSPNGTRIAAGSSDGPIRVFDTDSGAVLAMFSGHSGRVPDLRWTPDGNIVTVGWDDDTVRLWDGDTGALLKTWTEPKPFNLGVSPDGSLIAASSFSEDEVVLLETATGERRATLSVRSPLGVAFDPVDGSRLAVASLDFAELGGGLFLFDTTTGEEQLNVPLDNPCEVAWSPDGRHIGVAGDIAQVVDSATGAEVVAFLGHRTSTCTIDFSADGELAVTGGNDGAARVWDAATGQEVVPLVGHAERVGFVDFSPDDSRVLSTSPDGTLRVWDVRPEGRRETVAVNDPGAFDAIYLDGTDLFLSAGPSAGANLWSRPDGSHSLALEGSTGNVTEIAASTTAGVVTAGSVDGMIRFWSIATGEEVDRLDAGEVVDTVDLSADGTLLAFAANTLDQLFDPLSVPEEISLHLVNLSTDQEIPLEDTEGFFSLTARISPDGTRLAAANGTLLRFWDTGTGNNVMTIETGETGPWNTITSLDFDDSGANIIVAWDAGTVAIFNTVSGELDETFEGHIGRALDGDLSPDGTVLATAGVDQTVRFWDVSTGRETLRLEDPEAFASVDFSEDGSQLLVAGDFGVRVYEINTESLIDLAESRLVRWWTPEECFQYLGTEDCPPTDPG